MNGSASNRESRGGSGARGRWVVIAMIAIALALGLLATRYRRFLPRAQPPATQPSTTVR